MSEETPQLDEAADLAALPDAPPAQDDAQPADSNSPAGAAAGVDDDAQLDALIDTLRSGTDREAARQTYASKPRPTQQTAQPTEPATAAGELAKPGSTPAPAAAQPAAPELSAEDGNLLSRFHVRPQTFAKLNPAERGELLANLRTRHDAQVQMYQELQQLKGRGGQPAPAQQPQQPANPAAADDPLAAVDATWREYFGDDNPLAPKLKAAFDGLVKPLAEQLKEAQQAATVYQTHMASVMRDQEQADQSEGFKTVKDLAAKAGVNLDQRTAEGKANQARLLDVAQRFLTAEQMRLGEQWTRGAYNYAHAISDAFATTFRTQNILAQRRTAADAAVQAAKRGGDPSGLPARGQPARSEDDVLDDVYEQTRTHGREAGARVAAGRT